MVYDTEGGRRRMSEKRYTVLMIEDDPDVLELNMKVLARKGMGAISANTLAQARGLLYEHYDLILLDIELPDGSGLDFTKEVRAESAAPILMLTGKREDEDVVAGLLGGGDDYLTKPYSIDELYARIVALARRVEMAQKRGAEPRSFGGITMDPASGRAWLNGKDMLLKPKEFSLLWELVTNRGQFISGEALFEKLWGMADLSSGHTLRSHIYQLRKKIEAAGGNIVIEQERNKGYRLMI